MINILMATYNGERYLRDQIESLLSQDFKDFKIIIADDGSLDKTRSILKEYKSTYPDKFELIFNEKSLGAKKNFINLLCKYATDSEYIMFCDQDDVWLSNKISLGLATIKKIEGKEKQASLVYSDLKICDNDLKIKEESMSKYLSLYKINTFSRLLVENKVTGNTIIMNRELAKIAIKFGLETISQNIYMHDWYLALLASYVGNLYFLDKSLVYYRQHSFNVLGVKKLGIKDTIERKKEAKKVYELMYKQAKLVYKLGREKNMHTKALENFIEMQNKNRLQKILVCIQNKFYKTKFLLSISQMFSI